MGKSLETCQYHLRDIYRSQINNLLIVSKVWPSSNIIRIDLNLITATVVHVPNILRIPTCSLGISVVHNKVFFVNSLKEGTVSTLSVVNADNRSDIGGALDSIIPQVSKHLFGVRESVWVGGESSEAVLGML